MTKSSIADVSLKGVLEGKPDYGILYKYQRITDYALAALRGRYLYFSKFAQLNDPFDPFLSLIASELDDAFALMLSDAGPKIFCVAEDPYNPLMWAHYADSGAGMCIGYAVYTGSARLFNPVKYVDTFAGRFNVGELLYVKSRHWEWEAEWRACIPGPEQQLEDLAYPVSICLGPRCTTENMKRVRAVMPSSVRDFMIIFPRIENAAPCYGTYKVDDIVGHYGRIPKLGDLFRVK